MYKDLKEVILNLGAEGTAPQMAFQKRRKTSVGKGEQQSLSGQNRNTQVHANQLRKYYDQPSRKVQNTACKQIEDRRVGTGGRVLSFPFPVKKSLWVGPRPSAAAERMWGSPFPQSRPGFK